MPMPNLDGAPLRLDQPARQRRDGTTVTIGEAVIEAVSLGQDYTAASQGAGVSVSTLHNWRVNGARARTATLKGLPTTKNDDRLAQFLDGLEKAEANAELERLAIIHRATQPYQVVKVIEKIDAKTGDVLERTTHTETRPGQWTPAAWWLERRMPGKYARRLELSGPDGGGIPIADRARTLGDSLAVYLQGVEDQKAEAEP